MTRTEKLGLTWIILGFTTSQNSESITTMILFGIIGIAGIFMFLGEE